MLIADSLLTEQPVQVNSLVVAQAGTFYRAVIRGSIGSIRCWTQTLADYGAAKFLSHAYYFLGYALSLGRRGLLLPIPFPLNAEPFKLREAALPSQVRITGKLSTTNTDKLPAQALNHGLPL